MTDACALYFSYILSKHPAPALLLPFVPPARAGQPQNQLIAYDHESSCRGLIYLPNAHLGNLGSKVLDLSKKSRDRLWDQGVDDRLSHTAHPTQLATSPPIHTHARASPSAVAKAHQRKTSTVVGAETSHTSTASVSLSDLERARSRIQGDILDGPHRLDNDLWRTALKMLKIGRVLLIEKKAVVATPPSWTAALQTPRSTQAMQTTLPFPRAPIIKTLEIPGMPVKKATTPTPLGNANPNKQLNSRLIGTEKASKQPSPEALRSQSRSQSIAATLEAYAQLSATRTDKQYRSKLRCGLSEDVWRRIIAFTIEAEEVISTRQQIAIMKWAMARSTLKKEQEWLGLKEALQIWHVLDSMDCLAYERDI